MTRLLVSVLFWLWMLPAAAHHVLGRPSYNLNEDSNTPPSMQLETQIGDYFVNYMVYPAFPRPGESGRINLYVYRRDDGAPYPGRVAFEVRDDSWFNAREERIGEQTADDNVFRQGFVFSQAGDYIITAQFDDRGQPYRIDFPLRVGDPAPIRPLGLAAGVLLSVLVTVSLVQRRRLMRARLRAAREERAA